MKIAICGTGSGVTRAPFNTDWEMWGMKGHWNTGKKFSRVYEIHTPKDLSEAGIGAEQAKWMVENITHIHPRLKASFPNAEHVDFEKHIATHGKYFTSSVSWMLAEAIALSPKEIGIWGITMSHDAEYASQKPAVTYLIGWAKALGIKVTIDKDAELLSAPFLYGYEDIPTFVLSMEDRKSKVSNMLNQAEDEMTQASARFHHAQGVLSALNDFENNFWSRTKRDVSKS